MVSGFLRREFVQDRNILGACHQTILPVRESGIGFNARPRLPIQTIDDSRKCTPEEVPSIARILPAF